MRFAASQIPKQLCKELEHRDSLIRVAKLECFRMLQLDKWHARWLVVHEIFTVFHNASEIVIREFSVEYRHVIMATVDNECLQRFRLAQM
jgi:hypothetical protein